MGSLNKWNWILTVYFLLFICVGYQIYGPLKNLVFWLIEDNFNALSVLHYGLLCLFCILGVLLIFYGSSFNKRVWLTPMGITSSITLFLGNVGVLAGGIFWNSLESGAASGFFLVPFMLWCGLFYFIGLITGMINMVHTPKANFIARNCDDMS